MPVKPTHTPPRQIRIGADWLDLEPAAKSQGKDRAEVVREFIAWYLRRPGAKLPERPSAGPWSKSPTADQ